MSMLSTSKKKSNKKDQDNLDDLLGDLLEADKTPKKTTGKNQTHAAFRNGGKDDDFYSSLAAMAENGEDSDVSEADVNTLAKSIAGLDDMDADLFGSGLKKRGSPKSSGSKQNRQGGNVPLSQSTPPPLAATNNGSPQRVASPNQALSPPNSARGMGLKKKPVKPSATTQSPPPHVQAEHKPGTAPGKMSDIRGTGANLKPGQPKEEQRPSTTPKAKQKYDFGDFDEDDPLAGLLLDEDSVSEAARKPIDSSGARKKTVVGQQAPQEEEPKSLQPQSPRKPSLLERPPTRSGSGNLKSPDAPKTQPSPPVTKHKEEMVFSDDDQFLDGLGLDVGESVPSTARSRLSQSVDEESRPARSMLDSLLGRGESSAASHLETKERPKQFVLDKKYTQSKGEKAEQDEDDLLFGNYQPSAASGSRPSSRRSVRFQDDDDIFGKDPPSSIQRQHSGGHFPGDMGWLEELSREEKSAQPSRVVPPSTSSTGTPTSAAAKPSQAQSSGTKAAQIVSKTLSSLLKAEEAVPQAFPTANDDHPKQNAEPPSVEQVTDKGLKKPNPKDWLGLGSSDSDEEYFKPKRVPSRSPGIVQIQPKILSPSHIARNVTKPEALAQPRDDDDNDEEDSLMERVRARREQSKANQATLPSAVSLYGAVDPKALAKPPVQASVTQTNSNGFLPGVGESHDEVYTRGPSALVSLPDADLMPATTIGTAPLYLSAPASLELNENDASSKQQQHQQQQKLLPNQKQQIQLTSHVSPPLPQTFKADIPGRSYLPLSGLNLDAQTLPSSLPSTGTTNGWLPSTLEEAAARICKLEIEKQYLDSTLESARRRYEEEVVAVEKSYKNRIQILEDANQKIEARLRGEIEQLMGQHLIRVKKMEQEKADLVAENYRRLEEQERNSAQETEKLKEKHRQVLASLKQEHEETIKLLADAKNKEIEKVASAHDTSRSLSVVVEQIQNNARDLGHLQLKMDSWSRAGLDEREIGLRAKDEQLKILQERLTKQEQDNEKERRRLEDLIARMEMQNREQLRQLEEERWKVKQEQSRLEAQQTALDNDRRAWSEQQARERLTLEKAREIFLEEQRSGLSHLTDERRSLAEERSKLNMEQKLYREKLQQDAIRNAQAEAEYQVLMKTIEEERKRAAERMRNLQKEEDRVLAERDNLNQSMAGLEHEKRQLEQLALNLKQRSTELEAMSEEANYRHMEGEKALAEARKLHSAYSQQNHEVEAQLSRVKVMEEHITQEKLRVAKEKKELESLKQAVLCASCRNSLQESSVPVARYTGGNAFIGSASTDNILAGFTPSQVIGQANYLPSLARSMLGMMPPQIETIASSIANDRAVRLWKIQGLKDQEYLEDESLFLEGLRHSPYHSVSKA